MQISDNFNLNEFKCKCGNCENKIELSVIYLLQAIRNELDEPMHITSGYRCPEHNADIGGVYHSWHTFGAASDVCIADKSKYPLLQKLALKFFEEVIYYEDKNFCHIGNPR